MNNMSNRVLFLRQENYNQTEIDTAVSRVFETLGHGEGVRHFVSRGDKVLLKINLIAGYVHERRVTTDPSVVRAVAKFVLDCGGQPIIADSPGIDNFAASAERAQIADVAHELGIPCVELLDPVPLPMPSDPGASRTFRKIEVARLVREADVILNLPKLKTHSQMTLTLGVKNLFGCIVGQAKAAWHYNVGLSRDHFAELLLDIACSLGNLKLTIVDGVIGMDGAGPTGGKPYPYGIVAAAEGLDVLAMDFCLCQMMGVKFEDFPLWRAAKKRNMSQCSNFNEILTGDAPFVMDAIDAIDATEGARLNPDFRFQNVKLPRQRTLRLGPWMPAWLERSLTSRPVHVPENCIGCGRCQSVCAAGALKHENKHVTFDYNKCIRCYCCHEMCPVQAIDFHESPIIKLGRRLAPLVSRIQHVFTAN